ncbi:hypothetical protein ABIF93_010347 [Bradyrhizobium japonicum]
MRILAVVAVCATLAGCMTAGDTVSFKASNPQQQALMRDGQPALVSRQKSSLVLVRPASRQLQANGRPVFVAGINNLSRQPVDFRVAQVEAIQHAAGSDFEMKIVRSATNGSGGWRQFLQRLSRRLRLIYDPQRPHRDILQPDGGGHRSRQCRRSK